MSNIPVESRSYVQRRELFKDIWNAAMLFDDDGDATDVMVKPKVIKTLRLEPSNHLKSAVRKKRLKNLRVVCNKILAFCDHQDAHDLYYDQIVASGKNAGENHPKKTLKIKNKKIKKKVKKFLNSTKENVLTKVSDSERKYMNIGDATVDKTRKPFKRRVPVYKQAVPMVASKITSKLTSTRSPLRNNASPVPVIHQNVVYMKSSRNIKKKQSKDNESSSHITKDPLVIKDHCNDNSK